LRATRPHARPARALLVLAAAASGLGLGPTAPPAQALPAQEEPTLPHAGGVAADVDVFKADDGDVVGALDNLHGNLRTELRDLESARSHLASAQDRKAKADQAVAATQKHIDDLTAQSDGVVVDAFMNPPADTALDAMGAASAGDASLKASIVGMQHDADASILARLHGAHEDLDAHKAAATATRPSRSPHCGSSNYAIYEAPSSSCSPPTARPGTSMHERGLAIDITCGGGTIGRGSACFGWLAGHAAGYGLQNLPSEPWHWSTDGS
jgi:hypothetical protein